MSANQLHPVAKSRPGRKRLGDEVFVPATVKVEPSDVFDSLLFAGWGWYRCSVPPRLGRQPQAPSVL